MVSPQFRLPGVSAWISGTSLPFRCPPPRQTPPVRCTTLSRARPTCTRASSNGPRSTTESLSRSVWCSWRCSPSRSVSPVALVPGFLLPLCSCRVPSSSTVLHMAQAFRSRFRFLIYTLGFAALGELLCAEVCPPMGWSDHTPPSTSPQPRRSDGRSDCGPPSRSDGSRSEAGSVSLFASCSHQRGSLAVAPTDGLPDFLTYFLLFSLHLEQGFYNDTAFSGQVGTTPCLWSLRRM
jgi:hypothetical protein